MQISDLRLPFAAKKTRSLVGIDITPGAIRVIELAQSSRGFVVVGFAVEHFSNESFVDDQISDLESAAAGVRRALTKGKISAKRAAIAVSGPSVISKYIDLSNTLKDYELDTQIKTDAEQYIPFSLQDVSLDFEVVGPSENEENMTNILLVACKKELVENRLSLLEMAGLKAYVVDIETYAVENAMKLAFVAENEVLLNKTTALVNVGFNKTTVLILQNNKIVFTRDQNFGLKQLNEDIASKLEVDLEEADAKRLKSDFGDEDQAGDILGKFMDELGQQIERAFQYFLSSVAQHEGPAKIFLAGEVGRLGEDLVKGLNWRMGVPLEFANPVKNMSVATGLLSKSLSAAELQKLSPELIVATGLALRAFDVPRVF